MAADLSSHSPLPGKAKPPAGGTTGPFFTIGPYQKSPMKIHPLITTTEALTELCDRLSQGDFITVHTEFMRENTY